jgi:hypothetical protein
MWIPSKASLTCSRVAGAGDLFIHHHLGLGDMMHCNGLVRHYLEQPHTERVQLFCKQRYLAMVQWMYRDEPRIELLPIDEKFSEGKQVRRILAQRKAQRFLSVGHRALRPLERQYPHLFFDQLFYLQAGVPYPFRFSKCYWRRDLQEEERVYRKLSVPGEYAFVHDDPARGFTLDTSGINKPIIRNDVTESIFHLGLLLERASEVHCMESSLRCMIESLDMSATRLFLHNFRYPDRPLGSATCQKWTEISYATQPTVERPAGWWRSWDACRSRLASLSGWTGPVLQ